MTTSAPTTQKMTKGRERMEKKQEPILIYGAGGQAKVVVDIVERGGSHRILGLLEDRPELWQQFVAGYPVLSSFDTLADDRWKGCKLILAVGDNAARRRLADGLTDSGREFTSAIHPSAQISRDITIGPGTVVMANAVINSGSIIGSHVIINTAATVDHDSTIGDFAHISPGVHLAGGVCVGSGAQIGIGANVIPGVNIGKWSVVGAGATVIKDLADFVTAVGSPAVPIRS